MSLGVGCHNFKYYFHSDGVLYVEAFPIYISDLFSPYNVTPTTYSLDCANSGVGAALFTFSDPTPFQYRLFQNSACTPGANISEAACNSSSGTTVSSVSIFTYTDLIASDLIASDSLIISDLTSGITYSLLVFDEDFSDGCATNFSIGNQNNPAVFEQLCNAISLGCPVFTSTPDVQINAIGRISLDLPFLFSSGFLHSDYTITFEQILSLGDIPPVSDIIFSDISVTQSDLIVSDIPPGLYEITLDIGSCSFQLNNSGDQSLGNLIPIRNTNACPRSSKPDYQSSNGEVTIFMDNTQGGFSVIVSGSDLNGSDFPERNISIPDQNSVFSQDISDLSSGFYTLLFTHLCSDRVTYDVARQFSDQFFIESKPTVQNLVLTQDHCADNPSDICFLVAMETLKSDFTFTIRGEKKGETTLGDPISHTAVGVLNSDFCFTPPSDIGPYEFTSFDIIVDATDNECNILDSDLTFRTHQLSSIEVVVTKASIPGGSDGIIAVSPKPDNFYGFSDLRHTLNGVDFFGNPFSDRVIHSLSSSVIFSDLFAGTYLVFTEDLLCGFSASDQATLQSLPNIQDLTINQENCANNPSDICFNITMDTFKSDFELTYFGEKKGEATLGEAFSDTVIGTLNSDFCFSPLSDIGAYEITSFDIIIDDNDAVCNILGTSITYRAHQLSSFELSDGGKISVPGGSDGVLQITPKPDNFFGFSDLRYTFIGSDFFGNAFSDTVIFSLSDNVTIDNVFAGTYTLFVEDLVCGFSFSDEIVLQSRPELQSLVFNSDNCANDPSDICVFVAMDTFKSDYELTYFGEKKGETTLGEAFSDTVIGTLNSDFCFSPLSDIGAYEITSFDILIDDSDAVCNILGTNITYRAHQLSGFVLSDGGKISVPGGSDGVLQITPKPDNFFGFSDLRYTFIGSDFFGNAFSDTVIFSLSDNVTIDNVFAGTYTLFVEDLVCGFSFSDEIVLQSRPELQSLVFNSDNCANDPSDICVFVAMDTFKSDYELTYFGEKKGETTLGEAFSDTVIGTLNSDFCFSPLSDIGAYEITSFDILIDDSDAICNILGTNITYRAHQLSSFELSDGGKISTPGGSDGILVITPKPDNFYGFSDLQYTLSGSDFLNNLFSDTIIKTLGNSVIFSDLFAGSYTVLVEDLVCNVSLSDQIILQSQPAIQSLIVSSDTCANNPDDICIFVAMDTFKSNFELTYFGEKKGETTLGEAFSDTVIGTLNSDFCFTPPSDIGAYELTSFDIIIDDSDAVCNILGTNITYRAHQLSGFVLSDGGKISVPGGSDGVLHITPKPDNFFGFSDLRYTFIGSDFFGNAFSDTVIFSLSDNVTIDNVFAGTYTLFVEDLVCGFSFSDEIVLQSRPELQSLVFNSDNCANDPSDICVFCCHGHL